MNRLEQSTRLKQQLEDTLLLFLTSGPKTLNELRDEAARHDIYGGVTGRLDALTLRGLVTKHTKSGMPSSWIYQLASEVEPAGDTETTAAKES